MIRIHIFKGSKEGKRLDFNKDIIYLGRTKDNDIQMNNLFVSRNHLKIMNKRGQYFIEDLNSTNGTYFNGEYIEPRNEIKVKEGLPLVVGPYIFSLEETHPRNDLYRLSHIKKEKRHSRDRRGGIDRRSCADRRNGVDRRDITRLNYGNDRRSGVDRRKGHDRRDFIGILT